MPAFIAYDPSDSTGTIQAAYECTSDQSEGLKNKPPEGMTLLEVPDGTPAIRQQARYKIANGALVQKNIVPLASSAPTFPADGTSTVDLTFSGLNASAIVQVGGQAVTVSPSDNIITLSSDTPQPFTVQLVDAD